MQGVPLAYAGAAVQAGVGGAHLALTQGAGVARGAGAEPGGAGRVLTGDRQVG